jgi:hypothetical protein
MSSISGRAGRESTGDDPAPAAGVGTDGTIALAARGAATSERAASEDSGADGGASTWLPVAAVSAKAGSGAAAGPREGAAAHPSAHINITTATLLRIAFSL